MFIELSSNIQFLVIVKFRNLLAGQEECVFPILWEAVRLVACFVA
jgi:hypothetical protein